MYAAGVAAVTMDASRRAVCVSHGASTEYSEKGEMSVHSSERVVDVVERGWMSTVISNS